MITSSTETVFIGCVLNRDCLAFGARVSIRALLNYGVSVVFLAVESLQYAGFFCQDVVSRFPSVMKLPGHGSLSCVYC